MAHGTCSIEGCDTNGTLRRGWCDRHYARWRRHRDPQSTAVDRDVERRIRSATVDHGGCWVYTGQPSARYPETRIDGRRVGIHRWSYENHHGPIPDGYDVHHLCRVPRCWNPKHLQAIPAAENHRDNVRANAFASQGSCINGHELTPANVYRPPGQPTRRMCRTCRRLRKQ